MKIIKRILVPIICGIGTITTQAQTKCATHENHLELVKEDPSYAVRLQELEEFIQANTDNLKKTRGKFTIPVVFHVIHSGQAEGTAPNVSAARLQYQLDVLNRDFNKKNSDSLKSNHPFFPIAGNAEIEFCLAQQSPTGAVSTGINRYNFGYPSFDQQTMNGVIKPQTIWDSKKYLNIWVCNLVDPTVQGTLLGYAQFPLGPAYSDGVVLLHSTVPTSAGSFAAGRTAVHEVGHYLNLRHIWGDDSCGNDFVNDTPPALERNFGCPSFPHRPNNGCDTIPRPHGEMYMNYMDYVNDNCMNSFSKGQVARMQLTMEKIRSGLNLNAFVCGNGVAINNVELENQDIHLFPNPATSEINVRFGKSTDKVTVSVINATGTIIAETNQMPKNDIIKFDIANIPSGVYLVKVACNGSVVSKRFTKQ